VVLEPGFHVSGNLDLVPGAKNTFDEEPAPNVLYDCEVAGSKTQQPPPWVLLADFTP
jgi:hypothetical protein